MDNANVVTVQTSHVATTLEVFDTFAVCKSSNINVIYVMAKKFLVFSVITHAQTKKERKLC